MESVSPTKHEQQKADFERDRQEEFLMDAIGDIKNQECEHTPDLLEYLGTDDKGDQIHQIYQCKCGKRVTEIFTSDGIEVSE